MCNCVFMNYDYSNYTNNNFMYKFDENVYKPVQLVLLHPCHTKLCGIVIRVG